MDEGRWRKIPLAQKRQIARLEKKWERHTMKEVMEMPDEV